MSCTSLQWDPSTLPIFGIPEIPPPALSATQFSSNEPLSTKELEQCTHSINEAAQALRSVDGLDEQMGAILEAVHSFRVQLKTRRASLLDFQARHQQRSKQPSTAHDLIPEILSKIFLHHQESLHSPRVPNLASNDNQDSFNVKHGPLVLTWVCSRWREVAIATSQLWTNVKVVDRTYYAKPITSLSRSHLLDLWLHRARHIPINLQLLEHPLINAYKDTSHFSGFPRDLTKSILKCFPLCKSIHIHGSFRKAVYLQMYFPDWLHLPLIENLRIVNSCKTFHHDAPHNFAPLNAPRLKNVDFNQVEFLPIVQLGPSCERIRTLRLDLTRSTESLAPHHVLNLIAYNVALESLDLACTYHCPHSHFSFKYDTVLQTSLKTLKLSFEPVRGVFGDILQSQGMGALFDSLELPSLTNLTIKSRAEQPWDHSAFHTFLSNSPQLQKLSLITPFKIYPAEIISYIGLLPDLRDIHIDFSSDFIESAIEEFRQRSSLYWPRFLPSLYLYPERAKKLAHIASTAHFSHLCIHLDCFNGNEGRLIPLMDSTSNEVS